MGVKHASRAVKFVAGPLVAALVVGLGAGTVVSVALDSEFAVSRPFEVVTVNTASATGATTARDLQAGVTYTLEASGTYQHGKGEGDAECATNPPEQRWLRNQWPTFGEHLGDLLVNGAGIEWQATSADVSNCNTANHTYLHTLTPTTPGKLTLKINDLIYTDNVGVLTVKITEEDQSDPAGEIGKAQAEAQKVLDDTTETVEQTRAKAESDAQAAQDQANAEVAQRRAKAESDAQAAQDQANAEVAQRRAKAESDAQAAQDQAGAEADKAEDEVNDASEAAGDEVEAIVGDVAPGPVAEAVLGALASLQADADAALEDVRESQAPAPDPGLQPKPDPDPDPQPAPDPDPEPEPEPAPQPKPQPKPSPAPAPQPPAGTGGSTPGGASAPSASEPVGAVAQPETGGQAPVVAGASAKKGDQTAAAAGDPAVGGAYALSDDLFTFDLPERDGDEEAAGRQAGRTLDLPATSESRVPALIALLTVVGLTLGMGFRAMRNARFSRGQPVQRYR